ncbi:hypothetical protein [Halioxenophilus aromaticivorans]|uniref:Uncharacterized protein n=1 Tax=Halioxenophilus aromaticivorans TaxID=1306992 RepID=A0AAV3TZV1_9ALTE
MRRTVLITLCCFALTALAQANSPAIGTLETQQYRVLIHLKESKPVYTVQDHQGNELARELPRDELFAAFPDLRSLVTGGVAKDASLERGQHSTDQRLNSDELPQSEDQ